MKPPPRRPSPGGPSPGRPTSSGPAPARSAPRRSAPDRPPAGRVLRATLEYDGGRYRGWQSQMNARTVQGTFAAAVEDALGPSGRGVKVQGAGRTDAGVHALAQVASIHLPPAADVPSLPRLRMAINDRLPADVNLLSLAAAPAGFHARHAAALRIYRYRIARRRTAFGKPFVWWVKEALDEDAMRRAAAVLPGRHDFASFCENADGHDSTLVEVEFAELSTAPDLLLFRIGASHYLWKMVRRLVGALVAVGTGRLTPDGFGRLLTERSPKVAEWTAPPSGLFLEAVIYPGDPEPEPADPLRPAF